MKKIEPEIESKRNEIARTLFSSHATQNPLNNAAHLTRLVGELTALAALAERGRDKI